MTEERELLVEAVEWMHELKYVYADARDSGDRVLLELIADINKIEELLDQPEQEPVAWQFRTFHGKDTACSGWDVWEYCTETKFNYVSEYITKGFYQVRKLYTTQAQAKREPLSDEEITKNTPKLIHIGERLAFHAGVRFSEKAHGIGGGE